MSGADLDLTRRKHVLKAVELLGDSWIELHQLPVPEGSFLYVLRDQISGIEQALRFRLENNMDLLEAERESKDKHAGTLEDPDPTPPFSPARVMNV